MADDQQENRTDDGKDDGTRQGLSDTERLRQLEAKIAEAKGEGRNAPTTESHYSQANTAWRMVTELVAGIVIGLGIGLGLDTLFGTGPFMLVLFILLGFVAGIKTMMRTATEVQKQNATSVGRGNESEGD